MSPHPRTVRARQLETGLRSEPRSFPPCVESGPGEGMDAAESQRAGRQASENSNTLKSTGSRGLRRGGRARQSSLRQWRGNVQKAEEKKHPVEVRIQKQEARCQEPEPYE